MLLTVKQSLISFQRQSTKQVQLVDNEVHDLYSIRKTLNKQNLLNTQQALLISHNKNTTVPLFNAKHSKTIEMWVREKKCPYI